MSVSKNYMQEKYGHLGELMVAKICGKNKTCIEMVCENCNLKFLRPVYAWNRDRIFCSHKCNGDFYKTNATPLEEYLTDYDGVHKSKVDCKSYGIWGSMMSRANGSIEKRKPTYKDCSVSDTFKNHKSFHNWCMEQVGYGVEGYELDKDIILKGNKLYSEKTCCFVPKEINMLFVKTTSLRGKYPIGVSYNKTSGYFVSQTKMYGRNCVKYSKNPVDAFLKYKEMKESHIKLVADKYKGSISVAVYNALYSYEVEITD